MSFDELREQAQQKREAEKARQQEERAAKRACDEENRRSEHQREREYEIQDGYLQRANISEAMRQLKSAAGDRKMTVSHRGPYLRLGMFSRISMQPSYEADVSKGTVTVTSDDEGNLTISGASSRTVRYDDRRGIEEALTSAYQNPEVPDPGYGGWM